MAQYEVKINKRHKGKEFSSRFHIVGKVVPAVQREDNGGYNDVPYYQEIESRKTGKPRRVLRFQVETAKSNRLEVELSGMEMDYVYLYSRSEGNTKRIPWKDRYNKEKYPPSYTLISKPEWDQAKEFYEEIFKNADNEIWVEVKGHYLFSEFIGDDGNLITYRKRIIDNLREIKNGDEINISGNKIKYVTDFDSPEFVEVNRLYMQIGIKSTYQYEDTKDTKINGVFLQYGKERSEPFDVELMVPYVDPKNGKKALADAFATLDYLDFVEVIGRDNNRVEFQWVDVEGNDDDIFDDVDGLQETKRELVISGNKKGIEVIGVVKNSIMRGFLTEEELEKSFEFVDNDSDEIENVEDDGDIFSEVLIDDDDLPF